MINDRITMFWIDLETTGLDANVEVPLELGIKLTDNHGFVIAERKWLIHDDTPQFSVIVVKALQHEIVGPMHTKSGLWDDLGNRHETNSHRPIWKVDTEAVQWLRDLGVPEGLPMCGNSIGSLDRPFVLAHFALLNEYLGYRNIDMSSLKELCRMHNPGLYENLKPIIGTKENATHRVLGDIDAAILEYRAYLDNFLITDEK